MCRMRMSAAAFGFVLALQFAASARTGGADAVSLSHSERGRLPRITAAVADTGAADSAVRAEGSSIARTLTDRSADVANAKDFGAHSVTEVGFETFDSSAALAAAFRAARKVVVPEGTYLLTASLSVPTGKELRGSGDATVLRFKGVDIGVALGDGVSNVTRAVVRDLRIDGAGHTAFQVHRAWELLVDNVSVGGSWADGFSFIWTWGSTFTSLRTSGAKLSRACFVVGAAFNANVAHGWYTGSNYSPYNFLIDKTIGNVNGEESHGNHFAMLTAQGGIVGFYVRAIRDSVFAGLYTENVVHPVVIGDRAANLPVRAVSIVGASFGGPVASQAGYSRRDAVVHIDYANGLSLTGVNFTGAYGAGRVAPVKFTGGGGSGARAVARVTATGNVHSIEVLSGGHGYDGLPTVVIGGAGARAAATAIVERGAVTAVKITAAGVGYVPAMIPAAVRYNQCSRVVFVAPYLDPAIGTDAPFYPWIVRTRDAASTAGVQVLGDVSLLSEGLTGNTAELVKARGGEYRHFVVETGAAGERFAWPYSPPEFP
jgi:hypothetical protein